MGTSVFPKGSNARVLMLVLLLRTASLVYEAGATVRNCGALLPAAFLAAHRPGLGFLVLGSRSWVPRPATTVIAKPPRQKQHPRNLATSQPQASTAGKGNGRQVLAIGHGKVD